MWAYGIVVAPPGFEENLGFLEDVEDLPVQELSRALKLSM